MTQYYLFRALPVMCSGWRTGPEWGVGGGETGEAAGGQWHALGFVEVDSAQRRGDWAFQKSWVWVRPNPMFNQDPGSMAVWVVMHMLP